MSRLAPIDTAHVQPGDAATLCGWCLREPATTQRYATPSCTECAVATRQERVARWARAVSKQHKETT